jgi:hypothetical protein
MMRLDGPTGLLVDMYIVRWSLSSAGVLVACSLVPYILAGAGPFSGYAMMPGVIFGMYASVIISGNPHGGEMAPVLIVGSIVNFSFWTIVCYATLAVYFRLSKKSVPEK